MLRFHKGFMFLASCTLFLCATGSVGPRRTISPYRSYVVYNTGRREPVPNPYVLDHVIEDTPLNFWLQTQEQGMFGEHVLRENTFTAAVALTVAPMLLTYIFAQNYFTQSIDRTGLVG